MNSSFGSRSGVPTLPASFRARQPQSLFSPGQQAFEIAPMSCRLGCKRLSRKPTLIHRESLRFAYEDKRLGRRFVNSRIFTCHGYEEEFQSFFIYPRKRFPAFLRNGDKVFRLAREGLLVFPAEEEAQWKDVGR